MCTVVQQCSGSLHCATLCYNVHCSGWLHRIMEIGRCPEIPPSSVNTIIAAAVPDDDLDEDESAAFWGSHRLKKWYFFLHSYWTLCSKFKHFLEGFQRFLIGGNCKIMPVFLSFAFNISLICLHIHKNVLSKRLSMKPNLIVGPEYQTNQTKRV